MDKIAITTGDPNGIGAEITIKALNQLNLPEDKVVIVSNRKILDYYGKLDKDYEIIEIPYNTEIEAGKVTKEAGEFSFQSLKKVCEIKPNKHSGRYSSTLYTGIIIEILDILHPL